jgi:retron-type reverse transcriptase
MPDEARSLENKHQRILDQPPQRLEERGADRPIHGAVVAAHRDAKALLYREAVRTRYDDVLRGADREDRDFRRIDDRRELVDPEHTEVGDGKRAIRKVGQENSGRKTPGIDGVVSKSDRDRVRLFKDGLSLKDYVPLPVRRVFIPKANGRQRPLGIPAMKDRVLQCLVKLALEPEWEAVFEPHSYGFRPGRSVQDAAAAVKHGLGAEGGDRHRQRTRCRWVLDADIKSFFDEIDHAVILSRTPVFRRAIEGWLQAGVFTEEVFTPTEMGTPQGGVISPLLANIALHGIEDLFHEWSLVGGKRFVCETLETFAAPPQGYRKCRPENALNSLRGPTKPRKALRRKPPKIYGPYPDGSWRTLRLVVNDKRTRTNPALRKDRKLRDLRLIRYADDFVVLARSRRQLETVVLPKLREFLEARGLRLSPEKTRIVRDTEGFDFVGRRFKRLSPTKFLVRPRRSSIRKHLDTLSTLFRNHALPVGLQIQKANAIFAASATTTAPTTAGPCSVG